MDASSKGEKGEFTLGNHPREKGDFEGDLGGCPYRGAPKSSLNSPTTTTNRHPVDELADVRAEIRRLEAREVELRKAILAYAPNGLVGDQFEASVKTMTSERVDVATMRKVVDPAALAPFLRQTTTQTIRLSERTVPDDL